MLCVIRVAKFQEIESHDYRAVFSSIGCNSDSCFTTESAAQLYSSCSTTDNVDTIPHPFLLLGSCRLNDAPVRGFEQDVGNKTTLRLFYPESAVSNPSLHNNPDTLLVLVPFKQQDLRWLKEILYDEKRVRHV